MKFEDVLDEVPVTIRNWRRIVSAEVVPNLDTFRRLKLVLCRKEDSDIFDAMYIDATQRKSRFSEGDISELIEVGCGVKCSRSETLDPAVFRSIIFSAQTRIDSLANAEKASAFYRAVKSLLVSRRLPARSDVDRAIRIALVMHREAWVARSLNRVASHETIMQQIESLGLEGESSYIRGTLIDHRLLVTNAPDEILFPEYDKPIIDSYVEGFREALSLFECFDADPKEPCKEYGIAGASEDSEINILRLASMYGKDEAQEALGRLKLVRDKDDGRNAPRFLTIYNDLVEIEAMISIGRLEAAKELALRIESGSVEMGRSDLVGEARMLLAKAHLKPLASDRDSFNIGLELVKSVIDYYSALGNDAKVNSLKRVYRQADGVMRTRFNC